MIQDANNYFPTIALSPDGAYAYVAESNASKVWRVTLATGETAFCEVGATPEGLAITPDGSTLYVACMGTANNGAIYAIATDTFVSEIIPGLDPSAQPFAVAISPKGNYAYVTDVQNNLLLVVDIAQKSLASSIDLKPYTGFPEGIAITPNGLFGYIANATGEGARVLSVALTPPYDVQVVPINPQRYYDSVAITPDQAPIASFVAPTSGILNVPITFDGSDSSSPVGTIASYAWNFGDGSVVTTTSPTINHTYVETGIFRVTLTVTNTGGTSLEQTFTGQTVSNNGGPSAKSVQEIQIVLPIVSKPTKFIGKIHNRSHKHKFFLYTTWKRSHSNGIVGYELYDHHTRLALIASTSRLAYNIHFRAPFHNKSDMPHKFLHKLHDRYRIRAVNESGGASAFLHVKVKR